jgi:short-subunit dehydrogenase
VGGDRDRESLRQELRQIHENTSIRVTLIEPGMVDTPFFDNRPGDWALKDEDVARVVLFALSQPAHVDSTRSWSGHAAAGLSAALSAAAGLAGVGPPHAGPAVAEVVARPPVELV